MQVFILSIQLKYINDVDIVIVNATVLKCHTTKIIVFILCIT